MIMQYNWSALYWGIEGDEALQNSQDLFLHFELEPTYAEVIEN